MPDVITKKLVLTFTTEDPTKPYVLSLDHPKDALNVATVNPIMAGIISRDIILAPGGALVGIGGMKIIDTTTDDIYA
ncbi:MAG: DUF2922 domain-containing protein [bacterium]